MPIQSFEFKTGNKSEDDLQGKILPKIGSEYLMNDDCFDVLKELDKVHKVITSYYFSPEINNRLRKHIDDLNNLNQR